MAVDAIRAARMLGFGFFIYGPMQHFWYAFLDRRFPLKANVGHFAAKVSDRQTDTHTHTHTQREREREGEREGGSRATQRHGVTR